MKKAIVFANVHNIMDENGIWEGYHFTETARMLVELNQFSDPLILDLIRFSLEVGGYNIEGLRQKCIPLVREWLLEHVKEQDLWFECLKISPSLVEICPNIYKNRLEVARHIGSCVDIKNFPAQFRSDKKYMMEALMFDADYYELAAGDLQNDEEFREKAKKWGYQF
jgi:hypothetical protein